MSTVQRSRRHCVARLLLLFGLLHAPVVLPAAAPQGELSLPPLKQVLDAVQRHFAALDDYEPGDLISQSDVQATLSEVEKAGWKTPQAIVSLALPDDAYLVRRLRTEDGKRFMRKIATFPGAYDRLDRLSTIAGGRKTIEHLIRDRGGHKLIEYLATSQGGAQLGRMLARSKGGSNLNKPTGRLYTVEALVAVLSEIHQAQAKRLNKQAPASE